MKRTRSPCSRSSSSSSSTSESPRWDQTDDTGRTSSTPAKRPRSAESPAWPRSATGGNRRSSYDAARSNRSPGNDRQGQKKKRESQRSGRARSKESSDSDNSDHGKAANGSTQAALPAVAVAATTTFDVERYPCSSDNIITLSPMTIADAIKMVTETKYDELTRNRYDQPNTYSKDRMRKVLASVVMERRQSRDRNNRLCIVSLGAGSKSIGGAFLTMKGNRVHDCHAEVLARRGLVRFLYSQLEQIKNGNQSVSIFEKKGEVYALRKDVLFHLFISKPPCGDASVFGLHENHQNRKRRGIARVTPADGEGAIHISWPPEQDKTFNDYTSEQAPARLHKMCCSAKLARWNVTGIQGALLSLYIEPVYFSSITIGSQFNVGHLQRAVYTRISKIRHLSPAYRVNEPKLYQVSNPDNKTEKSHKMSLNWFLQLELSNGHNQQQLEGQPISPVDGEEELIECQSGLTPNLSQEVSRLSKMECFRCFVSLWDSLAPCAMKQKLPGVSKNQQTYSTVKAHALAYQQAKDRVADCFSGMPYGSRWLKMPPEVDQFSLRLDSSAEADSDTCTGGNDSSDNQ